MTKESLLRGAAIAVIASFYANPVYAQSGTQTAGVPTGTAAVEEPELGAIVVTAQRRAENLQDVPIAITAFTGESLERSGIRDVLELSQVTPSLLITEGSSAAQPFIRGVGGRNITPGNEATTALYVDGVYSTEKTGMLVNSFSDTESVQVLRGPQGTLFGRNATSGAILITTKKPQQTFVSTLEGTYGTDEASARGYITGGLTDTISASLSGTYRDEFAYIDNLNPSNGAGDKVGRELAYGFRGHLLFEPTSRFSVLLSGHWIKGYNEGQMAVQPIPGSPITVGEAASGIDLRNPLRAYYGDIRPEVRSEAWGGSLTFDLALDGVAIKAISSYRAEDSGVQLDLDASPAPVFWFDTDLSTRVWQQELNLSSDTDGPLSWIAGAYYINYRDGYGQNDQNFGLPVPLRLRTPNPLPRAQLEAAAAAGAAPFSVFFRTLDSFVRVKSLGLYGEAAYKLSDATKITVGLRYTDESSTLDKDNFATTTTPNGAGGLMTIVETVREACDALSTCNKLSTSFNELTYRAVLDHRFNDDLLVYASYNRGFKSGVYNISLISNVEATEPETIDAFEVGFKATMFNGDLSLNTAAYYYNYDNLQVPVVDPRTNTQRSINAAKAKIAGLEIEAAYRPTRELSLSAGFSTFFKSEYANFNNCEIYRPTGAGLALAPGSDCSGRDLPNTPNLMFSLGGTYTVPLQNGANIDFNGLFSYTGKFDHAPWGVYPAGVDAAGTPYSAGVGRGPIQRATETLNLAVTYRGRDDRYSLSVWGRDLFDQDDIYRNYFTTGFGYYTSVTRGFTAGVTLGLKFGG